MSGTPINPEDHQGKSQKAKSGQSQGQSQGGKQKEAGDLSNPLSKAAPKAEPANPKRETEAQLYHERQERKKKKKAADLPKNQWFELVGNKVVKKTRAKSGAVYSVYVGTRAQADKQSIPYKV